MKPDAVTPVLVDPSTAPLLDLRGWDALLRQARHANLLARIARDVEQLGALDKVPAAPRAHLIASLTLAARQRITVRAEVRRVGQALAEEGLPLVLLKGAAYAMADLPCADGRLFGDIDLLVAREDLPKAESVFMRHGWQSSHHSTYDQQYYRRWMHELPPLEHLNRHSVLDVHHNILPATAKHPPDARLLLDAAQPIPNEFELDIRALAPADMVLHSACHLFHEGELGNGLRDLADLDRLLRHFALSENFWPTLIERSNALHLTRPLYYALHLCAAVLHTPVPKKTVAAITDAAPAGLHAHVMDALYLRALRPDHHLAEDRFTLLARWLLYVRGHWLRMPPHLLAWHLGRKSLRRILGLEDDSDEDTRHTHGDGGNREDNKLQR